VSSQLRFHDRIARILQSPMLVGLDNFTRFWLRGLMKIHSGT
jgi:hypothetical protein